MSENEAAAEGAQDTEATGNPPAADPRPPSQIEAEEANAAEEPRQIVHAEGDRSGEAASAQAYADAGIVGAPGSEVSWPTYPEPYEKGDAGEGDAGEQASG